MLFSSVCFCSVVGLGFESIVSPYAVQFAAELVVLRGEQTARQRQVRCDVPERHHRKEGQGKVARSTLDSSSADFLG